MSKRSFTLSLFIVFLLAIYFITITLNHAYIGIEVKQGASNEFIIVNVYKNGVATDLHIKKGDVILEIDGRSPIEHITVKKFMLVEQANSLVIQRQDRIVDYEIPSFDHKGQFFLHLLFPLIFLSLSLVISSFLYIRKGKEKNSFILILLLLTYGLSGISGAASSRADIVALLASITVLLFIPLFLLHFFYQYFLIYKIRFVSLRYLRALYMINGLLIVLAFLSLLLPISDSLYPISRSFILVMFIINVSSCLFYFGKCNLKYRRSIYNSLFKIINVGMIFSFLPFGLLYAIPNLVIKQSFISGEVAFLCTYILPLTFVYLVIANRFLDIDFYIRRAYYYALFSIIPSTIITLLSLYFIVDFTFLVSIKIFISIYCFSFFFFYLKEELDYRFRSKLFSEKRNFQSSIYQFVVFLAQAKNKRLIEEYIIKEVKMVLGIKNAAILEYTKDVNELHFNFGDRWEYGNKHLKRLLSMYDGNYFLGELHVINSSYYLIMGDSHNKVSILVLGVKKNLTSFNLEEKEWLKTIAYYMNVSYQNLRMIDDLVAELEKVRKKEDAPAWISSMLFKLEEKERQKLSIDLHDSGLQDQLVLYQKLNSIILHNDLEPSVRDELHKINEGMLDVIHEIRETCNELMPPFLKETGIITSIENLVKKTQLRTNLVVDFVADFDSTILLNDDLILTFYRVIQELMNNAEKHSNATNVSLLLLNRANSIQLKYRDDGVGFDVNIEKTMKDQIGINGIKERIRSVQGSIEFNSLKTGGLEIFIEAPIRMNDSQLLFQ